MKLFVFKNIIGEAIAKQVVDGDECDWKLTMNRVINWILAKGRERMLRHSVHHHLLHQQ